MTTLVKSDLDSPVESVGDLEAYLATGAREESRWGVGAEMEKLVVEAETGEAASFARIEALLQHLEDASGWQSIREEGRLIALLGEASSITLEPGGQLELSGRLCPDLHCCHGDFAHHTRLVAGAAETLGLRFLGLGAQPFTPLERIDLLPKARYRVMDPYMQRTGDRGRTMMRQTAGLQVNLDFCDEADCIDKMRLALALTPLLYALFANSPIMEDRPTGFLTTRGEIWARTDPDRTGLLPEVFRDGAGFGTYVEYALDVPMYFIVREGRFIDLTRERFPFRRFLADGFGPYRATLADWDLHLSTLFPEVRLRPQIEVRPIDSLPPEMALSAAALLKGLLYDATARQQAWQLVSGQNPAERDALNRRSWRLGLKAPWGRHTLAQLGREILELAREGLRRQQRIDARGLDEGIYLEGLQEIVATETTLAERLLGRWRGSREEKLTVLADHCGFRPGRA